MSIRSLCVHSNMLSTLEATTVYSRKVQIDILKVVTVFVISWYMFNKLNDACNLTIESSCLYNCYLLSQECPLLLSGHSNRSIRELSLCIECSTLHTLHITNQTICRRDCAQDVSTSIRYAHLLWCDSI